MDPRLVRTAVLGGPDSLEPVIMPMVYEVAMGLRLTHRGHTFWCGTWLGGCGAQLMTKIGRQRIPHFAHYPEMAGRCRRTDLGEASADHLFIHKDLKTWLGRQGVAVRRPRLLGDIKRQGTCTGLLLETADAKRVIAVVLDDRNAEEWKRLYEEFRASGKPVDWLYSPGSFKGRALAGGQGTGLLAMCQYVSGERRVRLGARNARGRISWVDLTDCKISGTGIVHPDAAAVKQPPPASRSADQDQSERPSGRSLTPPEIAKHRRTADRLLRTAKAGLSKGDRASARIAFARLAEVLDKLDDGYLASQFKDLARRIDSEFTTVVRVLGEDLEKEAQAGEILDAAFDALRHGDLEHARSLQERVTDILSEIHRPSADLQRRSRSCAAQIRDSQQRQREHKRARPLGPGQPRKNRVTSDVPAKVPAAKKPREGGPEGPLNQQVAAMKIRLRTVRPSRRLRRDLNNLLNKLLSREGFETDRRLFETYLQQHWGAPRTSSAPPKAAGAALEALSAVGSKGTQQSELVSAPQARCSCGWVGKSQRFHRHTKSPAFQGKVHKRLV